MDLMTRRRALLARKETNENLFYGTIIQGSFNADGSYAISGTRIRTENGINVTAGNYVVDNAEDYDVVVWVFTTNNSVISSESFISWQSSPFEFPIVGDRLVKFAWKKQNNNSISPSDITGITLYKQ